MPDETRATSVAEPEVGSYFVANYPPFSVWTPDAVASDALPALDGPPRPDVPLGLYLHIPFCRKRCHFCYFRVYTNKNAQEIESYLDLLAREWELYATRQAIAGRRLSFVYFGGGTPSFLSTKQLESLVGRLSAVASWDSADEVTFECEPGTLTGSKLDVIRQLGVTRLSLGVENFDSGVLEINGRAHRAAVPQPGERAPLVLSERARDGAARPPAWSRMGCVATARARCATRARARVRGGAGRAVHPLHVEAAPHCDEEGVHA